MVDAARLKESFATVAQHGDEVPLFFYSYLFLRYPQVRPMFPASMALQRDRLVGALARIVGEVDQIDSLVPFVEQLGRDHRKYRVVADHYPAVGEALLATLRHFLGPAWTADLASDWAAAYAVVSDVMVKAAAEVDKDEPSFWQAEIVSHERRRPDLAVLHVVPESPVPYEPGQSVSVHHPRQRGMWRFYSPANAPRPDGQMEFHVRAVDGGWVSSTLVMSCGVGDALQVGPAVGELRLDLAASRDVLLLAGGTGLAPLRAMVEQLAAAGQRRRVHLFHEALTEADLYDVDRLEALAATYPWLTVTFTARRGSVRRAVPGGAAEAALRLRRWSQHDVYVCGSVTMVGDTMDALLDADLDMARVRTETFGYRSGASDSMPTGGEAR